MTQTSIATQIVAQIASAREDMQHLISRQAPIEIRELQERLINRLKGKLAACPIR